MKKILEEVKNFIKEVKKETSFTIIFDVFSEDIEPKEAKSLEESINIKTQFDKNCEEGAFSFDNEDGDHARIRCDNLTPPKMKYNERNFVIENLTKEELNIFYLFE